MPQEGSWLQRELSSMQRLQAQQQHQLQPPAQQKQQQQGVGGFGWMQGMVGQAWDSVGKRRRGTSASPPRPSPGSPGGLLLPAWARPAPLPLPPPALSWQDEEDEEMPQQEPPAQPPGEEEDMLWQDSEEEWPSAQRPAKGEDEGPTPRPGPKPPSPPPSYAPRPVHERVGIEKASDQHLRPEKDDQSPAPGRRLGGGGGSGRTSLRKAGALLAAVLLFSVVGAITTMAGTCLGPGPGREGVSLASDRTAFNGVLVREATPSFLSHVRAEGSIALADSYPVFAPEPAPCARLKHLEYERPEIYRPSSSSENENGMMKMLEQQRAPFARGMGELHPEGYDAKNDSFYSFKMRPEGGQAASSSAAMLRQAVAGQALLCAGARGAGGGKPPAGGQRHPSLCPRSQPGSIEY